MAGPDGGVSEPFAVTFCYDERERADFDRLKRRLERDEDWRPRWYAYLFYGYGAALSLLAAITLTGLGLIAKATGGLVAAAVFGVFILGAWAPRAFSIAMRKPLYRHYLARHPDASRSIRIRVSARGLRAQHETSRSFYPAGGLKSAAIEGSLLVIWTRSRQPIALPRRVLDATQQAFLLSLPGKKS